MKRLLKTIPVLIVMLCLMLSGCSSSTPEETATPTEAPEETAAVAVVDNPSLGLKHFSDILGSGKLLWENEAVSVESCSSGGVLIRGANEELGKVRFLIDEDYDFGSSKLQRIMINGLGEKDCITKVSIYLDGADAPSATITLNPQTDKGTWEQEIKNVNEIVSAQNITGRHEVEFSVCQYLENGEAAGSSDAQILLESVQFVAETIPLINIRIDESQGTIADMNNDETHSTKCTGEFDILVPDDYGGDYGGTYQLNHIKGRGNSTWTAGLRLPYKLKLSEAADLFGMGSNANWALLANAYDNDLIRNAFTYKLGEELGLKYTPGCVCVDVVMNGEYLGSYTLCESIRVESGRIEIDDLDLETNPDNITGGYLIGAGSWGADEDAYIFTTSHGVEFNVNSPCDASNPSYEAEIEYIVNYMQRVENALYGEPDPETGAVEDPFELMDLDAAIKYYWIQELSLNGDFFKTGSTYCYKERDGKLCWGPIWDFDIAWNVSGMASDKWGNRLSWFQIMLSNDTFVQAAEDYYRDTLKPLLDDMLSDEGFFNTYYEEMEYSALNNYSIWGITTEDGEHEYDVSTVRPLFEDSHEKLLNALRQRAQWCLDNLESLKTEQITVVYMLEDEVFATSTGYGNTEVMSFPENPEIEGKRFIEWDYNGYDWEGKPSMNIFNQYVPIPEEAVEYIDGVPTLVVYASFEDRDDAREVTEVTPQLSSLNLCLSRNTDENWIYLYFGINPADGYYDEIKWEAGDDSVIEVKPSGNMLILHQKKAGSTVITGTLLNGTVCTIPVTVTVLAENDSIENHRVTDFRLSADEITLRVGEEAFLGIEVIAPDNYLNIPDIFAMEYDWNVESGDACYVNSGNICAASPGTAVVSCRNTASDIVRTCTVTVVE